MHFSLQFDLNEKLFIKDPQQTDLGKEIIRNSIMLIDETGIESFTFRKLAKQMGSTEASMYRYFDSKYSLLTYLINWYWQWVLYLISTNTLNVDNPQLKLQKAMESIVIASNKEISIPYININILHRIYISEGSKVYHTKNVDKNYKQDLFIGYIEIVNVLSGIISEINSSFKYPRSLASNLFEMSNNQIYFAEHVPKLTDIKNNASVNKNTIQMLTLFTNRILEI